MRVVFEDAKGIICRGHLSEVDLQEAQLCAVLTYGEDQQHIRVARVAFGPVDQFRKLGPLKGYPGEHDLLLEWQRDFDGDPEDLQAVVIGGVTHYTTVAA